MESVVHALAALAHEQRLAVFRLLIRRYPDALPAGEIAGALSLKASTLSVYLATLRQAGLLTQARRGTSLLYGIDMDRTRGLLSFLVADCCRGRADLCPPSLTDVREAPMTRKFNVLFICSGNSARSIFAESILRCEAGAHFNAFSAGTKPNSQLNPFAVEILRAKSHDVAPLRAKNVAEFQGEGAPVMDFVFTVCDRAANEECAPWPGQPITGHWGVPDPVKAEGTDAQKRLAFQEAFGALRNRILTFTALPITSLDRVALQSRVDEIGREPAPQ